MKKSINAWSVESNVDFEAMFSKIKTAGFDGIELNVDANNDSKHSLTLNTTDEELLSIKALSEKYDLPVVSVSTCLYANKLGAPYKEAEEFSIALIKKQIHCAKMLGANGILCVPGGISETNSIKSAYESSRNTLKSLVEYINEQKIYVALENVWNTFFLSPYDIANFIDSLDCKYITAYYDVGNVIAFSWSEYFVEILDKRISHIHVKDFKLNGGFNSGGEFTYLMEGSLNWDKVMKNLKNTGFDGYLTAEIEKPSEVTFEEFYKMTVGTIDKIISLIK